MDIPQFVYTLSIKEHFCCSQALAITYKAALTIFIEIFAWIQV